MEMDEEEENDLFQDNIISQKRNVNNQSKHNESVISSKQENKEVEETFMSFLRNKLMHADKGELDQKQIDQQNEEKEKQNLEKQQYIKMQIQMIKNDVTLGENEKKIKIKILQRGESVGKKVQNIMQKHHQRNERKIPLNKEQKFQQNMKIFKGLNTFIDSKKMMAKMNDLNDQEEQQIKQIYQQIKVQQQMALNQNHFVNVTENEEKNDYFFESAQQSSIQALQKANQLLIDKNVNKIQTAEIVNLKRIIDQYEKLQMSNIYWKNFELKNENDLQGNNFYDKLMVDIHDDVFLRDIKEGRMILPKIQSQKFNLDFLNKYNKKMQQEELNYKDNMEQKLQKFKQKSNKILQMIVKTSKTILNKKMDLKSEGEVATQQSINQIVTEKSKQSLANINLLQPATPPSRNQSRNSINILKQRPSKNFNLELLSSRNNSNIQQKINSNSSLDEIINPKNKNNLNQKGIQTSRNYDFSHQNTENQNKSIDFSQINFSIDPSNDQSFDSIRNNLDLEKCGLDQFKIQAKIIKSQKKFENLPQILLNYQQKYQLQSIDNSRIEKQQINSSRLISNNQKIIYHKKSRSNDTSIHKTNNNSKNQNSIQTQNTSTQNNSIYDDKNSLQVIFESNNQFNNHKNSLNIINNQKINNPPIRKSIFSSQFIGMQEPPLQIKSNISLNKFENLLKQADDYKKNYQNEKIEILQEIDSLEASKEQKLNQLATPKLESLRYFDKMKKVDSKLFNQKSKSQRLIL